MSCAVPDLQALQKYEGMPKTTRTIDWTGADLVNDLPDLAEAFPELEEFICRDCDGLDAGPVWPWVSKFKALRKLDLRNTKRNGEMANIDLSASETTLEQFSLAYNPGFDAGPVPTWLQSFTALSEVDVADTNRNGPISAVAKSFAGSAKTLRFLGLFRNPFLAGPIPTWVKGKFPLFLETEYPATAVTLGETNRYGAFGDHDNSNAVTCAVQAYIQGKGAYDLNEKCRPYASDDNKNACRPNYEGDRCQTCKGCRDGLACSDTFPSDDDTAGKCFISPDPVAAFG